MQPRSVCICVYMYVYIYVCAYMYMRIHGASLLQGILIRIDAYVCIFIHIGYDRDCIRSCIY